MYSILTTLLLLIPESTSLVKKPPSIYRWIADSPYICNPAVQVDGSMVNFLHEEDGEPCTKCNHIVADFVATHACGIRIHGNEVDSRIGCFELPLLCVEEYVLRYSNFFHNHAKTTEEPVASSENALDAEEDSEEQLSRSRSRKEKELLLISAERVREAFTSTFAPSTSSTTTATKITTPTTTRTTTTEALAEIPNAIITKPQEMDVDNSSDMPFDTTKFEEINKDIMMRIKDSSQDKKPFKFVPTTGKILEIKPLKKGSKNMVRTMTMTIGRKGQKEMIEILPPSTRLMMLQKRKEHFFGTTTTTTVQPTTTTKAPCLDKNNLCCFWAISGECDTNPFWMRINCAKTCGTCLCSLREADFCVSTGVNCTLPSTTTTTTTTTTTPRSTTTMPTTKPHPPTTRVKHTRPFTPPKNGFGRTRSTLSTSTIRTTPVTTKPTTPKSTSTSTSTTTRTTTTTTTTATTPDPCQDLHDMCAFWSSLGECKTNPYWMRPHCQKSCRSCGEEVDTVFAPTPRKGCENSHKFCNFWASTGECETNPNWMIPHCPLSCRIC